MKIRKNKTCDVLVVGAGLAGMTAAARASSLGLKTIQAGNASALFFASGLFDLLGVYPIDSGVPLTDPWTAIKTLQNDHTEHPYSKVTPTRIRESFQFLLDFLKSAGLDYYLPDHLDKLKTNTTILTSVGTVKPTFIVPETISKGCDIHTRHQNCLILDFKGLRGFSAKQAASGLKTNPGESFIRTIECPETKSGLTPVHLAGLFETKPFIQLLSDQIRVFSGKADNVGIPAVCGVHNSLDIMNDLEHQTGMKLFEIPGMPPSIPGLRLKNAFEKGLSRAGVTFLSHSKIKFNAMDKDRFTLTAVNDNFETRITAQCVILATGRFPGGGLFAKRNRILETVFDLPVFQPENREQWHQLNFFDPKGHPINQAGLETDDTFRPLDKTGGPAHENLYAAGSILAHNDWVRLKSGAGVSCVSAYTAVNSFYNKTDGR